MSSNVCPDESNVLDLGIIRRGLIERLRSDGLVCEHDVALIRAFDSTRLSIGHRLRLRNGFESLMRNGLTRRTGDKAREAGLAVVVSDGQVADVVPLFEEGAAAS